MSLGELLASRQVCPSDVYRPQRFALGYPADADALRTLLRDAPHLRVRDTLAQQLRELLATRNPGADPEAVAAAVSRYVAERGGDEYGLYLYYPWRTEILRVLPEHDFVELRANRNQLLITAQEQRALREKRIAIVGLSVGHSMAVTLALEGVGGRFLLADPDTLELSNTNRVPAGLCALGENKAVLAARRMAEIDPYLQIEVWCDGVDRDDPGRLFRDFAPDLLVEECDDLPVKLALREHARAHRVPVITETSQRGLIDIERYDREPERPTLHGLLGGIDASSLAGLSTREKAPFGLRFMQGVERLGVRLSASLLEIEESLSGWPQLGSAVTLGGAMVTDVARRMFLGELNGSGRYRVDLGALVADGSPIRELGFADPPAKAAPDVQDRSGGCAGRPSRAHADRMGRWLEAATWAPSYGNLQPWRFERRGETTVACFVDPARARTRLDPTGAWAQLACGAAFESLRLAALVDGYAVQVVWGEAPDAIFEARMSKADVRADTLHAQLHRRRTSCAIAPCEPIPDEWLAQLAARAEESGARLSPLEASSRSAAARALAELSRVQLLSEALLTEELSLQRLGSEGEGARDGIVEACLDLEPGGQVLNTVLRRDGVRGLLDAQDAGTALGKRTYAAVMQAGALVRLCVPTAAPASLALAGVALQRVWLEATRLGLAVQPMGAGPAMLRLLDVERSQLSLASRDLSRLRRAAPAYRRSFPPIEGHADVLLLRLHRDPSRAPFSPRRPLSEVVAG